MARLSTDDYLMSLAFQAATRSTCDRFHAGCVVAREGKLVSTGYNGSLESEPHCDQVGHILVETKSLDKNVISTHCVRTIHAEINAIINAAYNGICIRNAAWYINGIPCWNCCKAVMRLRPYKIVLCSIYDSNETAMDVLKWLEYSGTWIVVKTEQELKELGIC